MSKDLFFQMREAEIATTNFLPTKKEIQKSSKDFAKKLVDSGDYELIEIYSQALRLKEAISVIEAELKNELHQEKFEAYGLTGVFRSGGSTLNYKEDEVWVQLKNDLEARQELLKLAQDQDVFDAYGNEVPKVSKIEKKSSLAISF